MIETSRLLRVIDLLYAAALDGDWTKPVSGMASLFGSGQAGLIQYDSRTRSPREIALVGIEPMYEDTYTPVAARPDLDPAWATAVARSIAGFPIIERYAANPELSRSELYQRWLRPQGIHEALEVSTMAPPRTVALMSVVRPAGAGEFDGEAIAVMRALQPHLRRALQVRQRLEGADNERQQMLDALDRIEHGVLLVDAQARVLHASRAAEALLRHGHGLTAADGPLACELAADSRALRRLIGTAAAGTMMAEGALAVRRSIGQPLSVLVAPLRPEDPWQKGSPACAIVIVADPERARAGSAAQLARRYGLTPAEARAALALLDGGGLSAVADRLSVRLSTVRTLVQRAFAKTGTHRQAELVRLITAREPPAEEGPMRATPA
jgi:DNA-binding CsgD family transcriptional regulator